MPSNQKQLADQSEEWTNSGAHKEVRSTMHPAKIHVTKLRVWYHFPLSLDPQFEDTQLDGWVSRDSPIDPSQATYFHRFISDALFSNGDASQFRVLQRPAPDKGCWYPEFDEEELNEGKFIGYSHKRFRVKPLNIEFWIGRQKNNANTSGTHRTLADRPSLGILAVEVEVNGVATSPVLPKIEPHALDKAEFRQLTLADAMDALEWLRRVFPRWRKDGPEGKKTGLPGDSISRVHFDDGSTLDAHDWAADRAEFEENRVFQIFPWIDALLKPLKLDGQQATHLGDERAFMCSAIAVETPKGMSDRAAMRTIPDGTLFRLAEADRAGDGGYNYNSKFLEPLRERYFYTRHAPGPWPVPKGQDDHGNSTLHLMSQHHLCAIGTGWFGANDMVENMGRYYRYMQLLCVFEYFRLIQFSQRLTKLVQDHAENREKFGEGILNIRDDFLHHTHVHHFTNVSSQLQAKEMFDQLYAVTGLQDMHREVEEELASATDYAALIESRQQAKRGEELNNLVAIGVPAGLALAIAGLDGITGTNAPDIPIVDFAGHEPSGAWFQLVFTVFAVFAIWFAIDAWRRRNGQPAQKWALWVLGILGGLMLGFAVWNGFETGFFAACAAKVTPCHR